MTVLCGGFYCYNSETTQFNDMPDNDEKANTLLMINDTTFFLLSKKTWKGGSNK